MSKNNEPPKNGRFTETKKNGQKITTYYRDGKKVSRAVTYKKTNGDRYTVSHDYNSGLTTVSVKTKNGDIREQAYGPDGKLVGNPVVLGKNAPSSKKVTYEYLNMAVEDLGKQAKSIKQKQKAYTDYKRIQELLKNPTKKNMQEVYDIIDKNPYLSKRMESFTTMFTKSNIAALSGFVDSEIKRLGEEIPKDRAKFKKNKKELETKINNSNCSKANKEKLQKELNDTKIGANVVKGGTGGSNGGGTGEDSEENAGDNSTGGTNGGTGSGAGNGSTSGTGDASTVPIAGVSSVGPGAGTSAEDLKAHLKAAIDNLKKTIDLVENNYTETQNYDKFIITENCKMSSTNIQNMINLLA